MVHLLIKSVQSEICYSDTADSHNIKQETAYPCRNNREDNHQNTQNNSLHICSEDILIAG